MDNIDYCEAYEENCRKVGNEYIELFNKTIAEGEEYMITPFIGLMVFIAEVIIKSEKKGLPLPPDMFINGINMFLKKKGMKLELERMED